jgi:hypothetical protein
MFLALVSYPLLSALCRGLCETILLYSGNMCNLENGVTPEQLCSQHAASSAAGDTIKLTQKAGLGRALPQCAGTPWTSAHKARPLVRLT